MLLPLLDNRWQLMTQRDAIQKSFVFGNFHQAWSFMNGIALQAEKMDHHPEYVISFNIFNYRP